MSTLRAAIAAWTVGAWWISAAIATGPAPGAPDGSGASGVTPGDDALTCEQIYAQGMAESQREQQERNQRIEQMRAQGAATSALVTNAMLTGGLGGTGPAAQAAAEAQADKQTSMLTPPPPNARMQRLRQLYGQKQCAGAASAAVSDGPAVRPGDESMTCEQIGAELAPYAQQIVPNLQALGSTQQQLYAQSRQMEQQRRAEAAAIAALAEAGALDPTGASKMALQAAMMAQMAKERAENEAFANSPLAQENKAQMQQLATQGQQLQTNGRVQRLMQLAQDRRCDKR